MTLALLSLYKVLARLCALGHPKVTANDGAPPYCNAAKDGGIAIDNDIVFKDGMAGYALDGMPILVQGEAFGTKGHALIEFDVVADDACVLL